jgi:hypothetical protein
MQVLRQSTNVTVMIGPFLDATDAVSEETGLGGVGVELSKNGAAWATRNDATATAHGAEGWYTCELDTTDTNTLGVLKLKAQDSLTHLPVWHEFMVMGQEEYDTLFGSDAFTVDLTSGALGLVADNVWDEDITTHTTADSAGKRVGTGLNENGAVLSTAAADNNLILAIPRMPTIVDLADGTIRFGFMLTNLNGDLPSAAEIDPGTYEIHTKNVGSATYVERVASTACLEADGEIYINEVFNAASGYADGQIVRVIFRDQTVTVGGVDHELISNAGQRFYFHVRTATNSSGIAEADVIEWLNSAPLALDSQRVQATAVVNSDKTGYSLAADQSSVTIVTGKQNR